MVLPWSIKTTNLPIALVVVLDPNRTIDPPVVVFPSPLFELAAKHGPQVGTPAEAAAEQQGLVGRVESV